MSNKLLLIGITLVSLLFIGVIALMIYMGPGGVYIQPDMTFSDVKVQPQEALQIAEPHLEEHGTYEWQSAKDRPLQTHIVRASSFFSSDWYYIKRTNYPSKSTRYYMHGAVKVHPQTGEVEFSKKRN